MSKLRLSDIEDFRAYEASRSQYLKFIIDLKKVRRVEIGPVVSMIFENRQTVRFQVQEMIRAEKILLDELVEKELEIYNPLIPEPGQLRATLFVELTTQDDMKYWLPKLVGIEESAKFIFRDKEKVIGMVACTVESAHEAQLTRQDVTSAVHYVNFDLDPGQVEMFEKFETFVAIDHPSYSYELALHENTKAQLVCDLKNGG